MAEQPWQYQPSGDPGQTLAERLRHFPREPDMFVYGLRTLSALFLRLFLHTYHRLHIVGREHLPRDGSFVMVANHASHVDALCLLAALPYRRLHRAFATAAQDYFFAGFPRVILATICVNAVPFARRAHIRHSLDLCRQVLADAGSILILFPEGTRTTTGRLGAFRPGIGSLLAGTDIPVVPCALHGAFQAWPKGARLPRPCGLHLVIGSPRRYASLPPSREATHHIAKELHDDVLRLLCK